MKHTKTRKTRKNARKIKVFSGTPNGAVRTRTITAPKRPTYGVSKPRVTAPVVALMLVVVRPSGDEERYPIGHCASMGEARRLRHALHFSPK